MQAGRLRSQQGAFERFWGRHATRLRRSLANQGLDGEARSVVEKKKAWRARHGAFLGERTTRYRGLSRLLTTEGPVAAVCRGLFSGRRLLDVSNGVAHRGRCQRAVSTDGAPPRSTAVGRLE